VTTRGRSVLALGVVVYIAAWAFGSKPLYPVATGLIVVCVLAWLWVRVGGGPFRVHRRTGDRDLFEGDDVPVRLKLEPLGRPPLATAEIVERIHGLGEQRHGLRRFGGALRIDYTLPGLRRGRYAYEDVRVELADPFGLQRVSVELPPPGALLVYPRLVALERLFSEAGAQTLDGRRVLLRRHAGFDLHSVREHVEGESLRRVHWPSTARRSRLMVRELEDTPRDEIAVVLDADPRPVAGESFDVQVRAAGSILDAYVRRGRRAVLVANSSQREGERVHSAASEWRRSLDVLAAVQPDAREPLASLLRLETSPTTHVLELAVVTAHVDDALVALLVQRALARRRVSLVYVDAQTFAGAAPRREPALLRLRAAGVAVAVVRAGDDLRRCLEGELVAEAGHG
jgi:uncharacterized protein (DUF58 family)